jgi:hypothetical protein
VREGRGQGATANATASEVKVSARLVQRATQRRTRMLKCASYYFDDHPTLGPELVDIVAGTGYRDLASDLTRLGKIYEDQKEVLSKDTRHYVAADAKGATKDAHAILEELSAGRTGDERRWSEVVARAWTLLSESYGEVAAAVGWLERDGDGAADFPPLVTVGRRSRRRPEGTGGEDAGDEAVDGEPGDAPKPPVA